MDRMRCETCGRVRYGSRLDCFDDEDDEICSSCGEYYTYRGIEDQYHRNDGDFFGPLPCDNDGEDYLMDEEDGFTYDEYYCNGIGDDDDGDWDEDEYFDNYTEEEQEEMEEEEEEEEEEEVVDVNSKVDDEGAATALFPVLEDHLYLQEEKHKPQETSPQRPLPPMSLWYSLSELRQNPLLPNASIETMLRTAQENDSE
ncbi:hypothetical protein C0Q70_14801 [Pomacea canaliculata]|uniref:Uncharacterized protein n=1 Tax=Pomacea canaliculata TaxID=400727 RepID=A0A2T7NT35_POMCA|nr:hypothetical protein C0Q70_14801 [Pomacea canaliculata]